MLEAEALIMSPQSAAAAIEANFCEFVSLSRHWPQAEVHDGPDCLWTLTGIPFPVFNTVLRARLTTDNVHATIEAAISRCASRSVPMVWFTGPSTTPSDLAAHLCAHGFTHDPDDDRLGMAIDLQSLPEEPPMPTGLSIQQVNDTEGLRIWNRVISVANGFPQFASDAFGDLFNSVGLGPHLPLRHFVGRLNGTPVAGGSLFLDAGVASVQFVATIPEARRRGMATAMVLRLLREARAEGYQVGVLEAREAVAGLYRRLGFEGYYTMGWYVWGVDQ
jgi:ribosomal protein S18 acetylase RimI-like enzyme